MSGNGNLCQRALRTVCRLYNNSDGRKALVGRSSSTYCTASGNTNTNGNGNGNTNNEGILRIVLTGGPCSGKSSALAFLQGTLGSSSSSSRSSSSHNTNTIGPAAVYCVPEAATLLVQQAGIHFNPLTASPDEHYAFQLAVCQLQLALEDTVTTYAANKMKNTTPRGSISIVVCDRGVLDNKGYMTDQLWQDVVEELSLSDSQNNNNSNVNHDDFLFQRYHGVVHMETAAKGALEFFKTGDTVDDSGNPVSRRESPEEAAALDDLMWSIWHCHPHHHRVVNSNNSSSSDDDARNPFQRKLEATAQAVEDIRKAHHPSPS